jgi:hypothetical protein
MEAAVIVAAIWRLATDRADCACARSVVRRCDVLQERGDRRRGEEAL